MKKLIIIFLFFIGCSVHDQTTRTANIEKVEIWNAKENKCMFTLGAYPQDLASNLDNLKFIENCNFGKIGDAIKITNIEQ